MDKTKSRVMVIEDEKLLLDAITKKLHLSDIEVIPCTGGNQAIEYLEGASSLPDAIWLDYYLKDMNGLTFTHELKNDAHWQQIPVLVVSNSANTDNVKSMLELGVKKYLLKAEYRLEEIIDLLKDIINKSKRMKKILLVEDEQLLIESLVKRLTHEGFEVVVAHDGEDGLEKVTREKPDLILLDLIMPVMDGITMLKKLRVTADGKNIPVIILTNLSDENKFEEAMKAGSTDYLIKSDYTLEQLVERIKLRLGL